MEPDERAKATDKTLESTMDKMPLEENVPDPDEADLDDLDDMLDEFSTTKLDDSKQHVVPKSDPTPAQKPPQEPDTSEAAAEEFRRQLAEQMAALMGSMEETPEMEERIGAIMQELSSAADPGATSSEPPQNAKTATASASKGSGSGIDEPFQDTIRKTMERMQASGDQATAATASAAKSDDDSADLLAQFMKEMQNGEGLEGAGAGAGAGGSDEGFNKMLMGMMEQLTNKEILYEPMKELHDKFPPWIEKNKTTTKADDMKRYVEQQRLVNDIVARFEKKDYSDNKAEDREYIVERMQQMQNEGNPPIDLVGNMSDAFGDIGPGCAQQ